MKTGLELIIEERQRQVESEGWTSAHDDGRRNWELSDAACVYAMHHKNRVMRISPYPHDKTTLAEEIWPWDISFYKPSKLDPEPEERIEELTKAGALIAAEIDRIQRLK